MLAQSQSLTSVDSFLVLFQTIVFEALPFIVIGALISGTLEVLLPQRLFMKIIPKRSALAIAGSACLGLVFPMCECGIVPVMRRLLGKGLPLGCAVAYMLAAPIINPVVITSTAAAFWGENRLDQLSSGQMVTLRVGMAFVVAFLVGHWVQRLAQQHGANTLTQPIRGMQRNPETADSTDGSSRLTWGQKLTQISNVAIHDFIDITCFLILGALLAAGAQSLGVTNITNDGSGNSMLANPVIAVFYMMALAVILCLCSEADAFVAANMLGVPLSGKIAFLVLGPMLDLKLLFMYTRVFRKRLIVNIAIPVVLLVAVLSIAVHYLNQAGATP